MLLEDYQDPMNQDCAAIAVQEQIVHSAKGNPDWNKLGIEDL